MFTDSQEVYTEPDVVAHAFNPSIEGTERAETGSKFLDNPGYTEKPYQTCTLKPSLPAKCNPRSWKAEAEIGMSSKPACATE